MVTKLLFLEVVLEAGFGMLLVSVPVTLCRALGLHPSDAGFWARLVGAILIGIAVATALRDHLPAGAGLGLAGHVAINFSIAIALLIHFILGTAAPTKRGRAALAALAIGLTGLALVELAYIS
jgi:hypothetical protein